jgi:CheY-like chemotaxis protein
VGAGDFGWIEVQDSGPGIRPEVALRLFEPFFTTRFHGRGLGLASVAGIARTNHGAIEVESQLGQGARFRVWLPKTSEAPIASLDEAPVAPSLARVTILLVDDDDAVRRVGRRLLERAGYDVVEAISGAEALVRCEDLAVTAVLMDYTMPDLNGAETMARMRQLRPGLPVAICSGFSAAQARGGADAFLQKPYKPRELEQVVADLLRDRR